MAIDPNTPVGTPVLTSDRQPGKIAPRTNWTLANHVRVTLDSTGKTHRMPANTVTEVKS